MGKLINQLDNAAITDQNLAALIPGISPAGTFAVKFTLGQIATILGTSVVVGKTLTVDNTLELAGVDNTKITFQGTDTYVGRATTDILTNKTLDTAGPNTLKIAGTSLTAVTGTGNVVLATSPTLVTPALGTPVSGVLTSCTGLPISTGVAGLGIGIAAALAINTGSAGAPILFNGTLGTPSSGTLTNATGLPVSTGISGLGTGVVTALAVNVGSAGAFVTFNGALGTPSSGTLTNATGLPISTGVSGLAAGVATFLGTPSSANFASALTDKTGTGVNVFATSPSLTTPLLGTPTSGVLTNCTGLPISTGVSGLATGIATWLATPSSANLLSAQTDKTGTGLVVFATSPTLTTPLLGTPTSGTLTNCTGLPVSTGISGLASGIATFLGTPSSANLASALTDKTGSGSNVFANTPTLTTPVIGAATGTSLSTTGAHTAFSGTAVPAGGTAGTGYLFSSVANFGVFFGSGTPTLSAAQGSLYLNTTGSSSSTRAFINSNGSTGWVAVTTAS